jgi:beta-N-acetylhexosaminidase
VQLNALADRVGGLLLVGSPGADAAPNAPPDIAETAGAILFERDLQSIAAAQGLVARLRGSSRPPRLIAVDQEGGPIARLKAIGTGTPSAMALGAADDEALTQDIYALIGAELAALGINLDLAPVADLNSNPRNPVIGLRSFGDDPQRVARHVSAAIRGLHIAGIAAAAKHFPGHGDTALDSHQALPVVGHDLARLSARELVPFRAAIDAGVDMVMSAHVAFPALEPTGVPATLSRAILTGLLREELGFDGVICTDAMDMKAIAETYDSGDASVRAVAAGADLVLFEHADNAARGAAALRDAVRAGTLDPGMVEKSLARVDALRTKLAASSPSGDATGIGSSEHRSLAADAARRAITIVRDPNAVLPFKPAASDRILVVNFSGAGSLDPADPSRGAGPRGAGSLGPASSKGAPISSPLGRALARGPARVQEQIRSLDPAGQEYKQLLMAAGAASMFIAITRHAVAHPLQVQAVSDLVMFGKPIVAIAALEPYDAGVLPQSIAVIATYGDGDDALTAAAETLMGTLTAKGKLPVRVQQIQAAVTSQWQ